MYAPACVKLTQLGLSSSPHAPPAAEFEISAAQLPVVPPATRVSVFAVASPFQPEVSTSKLGLPTRLLAAAATVHVRAAGLKSALEEGSTATTRKVWSAVARFV